MQNKGTHTLNIKQEINKLFYNRLYILFWVGFLLFPLFLLLDYFVAGEDFALFSIYRTIVAIGFLVLFFINTKLTRGKYLFTLSTIGLFIGGTAISAMVVQTGGYDSYYYVGMICILIAFTSILPLNTNQSIISASLIYLLYIVPILIFSHTETNNWLIFLNNNAFFIFFLIVCVIQSKENHKSRQVEFELRKSLDYYATNLEKEVKHRITKHENSELRYKELYENILDSMIVMDSKGDIFIANPNFYKMVGENRQKGKTLPFMEFVHLDDRNNVQDLMLEKLNHKVEIRDFQFRLLNTKNEIFHIECAGKQLEKAGEVIGYQLVLRDVSFRKTLENNLVKSFDELKHTRAATIMGLAKLTEYRDNETGAHLERIQEYVRTLTVELGNNPDFYDFITREYLEDICLSSVLHDIGKVGIPDAILLKPGKLDANEFDIIKRHCKYGGDAIKSAESAESNLKGESFLSMGKEIAYFHHEKWDGSGYPYAISNNQIPLSARIVAVADVYDALTSKRIYKSAYSHNIALEIIKKGRGKHFDPQVIDAFLAAADGFNLTKKQF
ncbi:PAS domain S-box protein [bacterium]|nr:PAS domain S-box protein [bacterium]